MIRAATFSGRRVAVFGLGASGLAAAKSLVAGGADVVVWDDGAAGRDSAAQAGFTVADLREANWRQFSSLVLAPGVPLTHPEPHWTVKAANEAGVEIIGDIEIFCRERTVQAPGSPFIAITGTNGKSTTTALTAHILAELGIDVQFGGNIGRAILTLDPPRPGSVVVAELSSFQIDLTPSLDPTVGVVLNVTPDHLDRHGTLENYAAIKERLAQGAEAACIGLGDVWTRAMADRFSSFSRVYRFSAGDEGESANADFIAEGSELFLRQGGARLPLASLTGISSLRGRHNAENALAALSAICALQDQLNARGSRLQVWKPDRLQAALISFPGLPHRMEEVGRAGGVLFINDSKATNADSTEKALLSFPKDVYWIVGGKPKDGGIETLAAYFDGITKAYLIGEASEAFAKTLSGRVPFEKSGSLDVAVARAAADAARDGRPDAVVLLSPACASYDQFKNFEVRGDAFRKLVVALPGLSATRATAL